MRCRAVHRRNDWRSSSGGSGKQKGRGLRSGLSVLAAGLLTTFVLVVAGAVLRARLRFCEDLERLAYWVLLPALLVRGLAGADFSRIAVDRAVAVTPACRPATGAEARGSGSFPSTRAVSLVR